MKTKILITMIVAVSSLGCTPNSETYFSFGEPTTADNDEPGAPLDACWLVGPAHEVYLVELNAVSEHNRKSDDCTVTEPYRGGYLDVEVTPIRSTLSDRSDGSLEMIAVYRWLGDIRDWKVGERALLSVRESEGTLFVMSFVPIDVVSNTPITSQPSASYDLPTSWSALESEVEVTRENHAASCTEGWHLGPSKSKQMSDAEFAAWVRTPAPKPCDSPQATPEPTDSGDGSDF